MRQLRGTHTSRRHGWAVGLLAALVCGLGGGPGAAQGDLRQRLNEASRLRVEGRYAEAVRAYEGLLPQCATDSERTQVWFGLGAVYQAQGNREGTLRAYTEITRLPEAPDPYRVSAWRQLANLYGEARRFAEARVAWERLAQGFPEATDAVAEAAMALGQLDLKEKQPAAAVARLHKYLQDNPDSPYAPDVWGLLVKAEVAAGDVPEAVATARRAWRQFPDRPQTVTFLVHDLMDRNQPAAALNLARECLLARPADAELFEAFYDVHQATGTLPQLRAWLEEQARAQPTEPLWLARLARVCQEDLQFAQALGAYERLLRLRPTDVETLRAAADTALRAREGARAEGWLRQALALRPEDMDLVTLLGRTYLSQGRPADAVALWKQSLGYQAQDAGSAARLGTALQGAGLAREALAVYQECRQARGEANLLPLQVGQAQEALLDFGAATREYLTALRTTPREAPSAGYRLRNMIGDAAARPQALATLAQAGPLEKLPPQAQIVWLYGRALDGLGETEIVADLARLSRTPEQGQFLGELAQWLEQAGQDEAAVAAYRAQAAAYADRGTSYRLELRVAELQARRGDWRGALATLAAPGPRFPDPQERDARQALRADLLLRAARRPAEAEAVYRELAKQPTARLAIRAGWGLADCAFARGDYAAAREAYAALATALPDNPELPVALPEGFARELRQPWRPPGADYVAYREAEMLFREGQYAKAREAFQGLSGRYPASPYANDALERLLLIPALTARPAGEEAYREALQAFERGDGKLAAELLGAIDASPVAEPAWLLRAQVQDWQGDRKAARQTLAELPQKFPDSPYAAEAWLQSAAWEAEENPAAARQQLQALVQRYPDAPAAEEAQALLQALSARTKER